MGYPVSVFFVVVEKWQKSGWSGTIHSIHFLHILLRSLRIHFFGFAAAYADIYSGQWILHLITHEIKIAGIG